MKLSESTLSLLKNFSTINQSILFKQGTKLRTISVMKNILAEATVSEELPKDFGIYDLGLGNTAYTAGVDTLNLNIPTPGIESNNPRKYKEDESIKALQDYISTTYGGHYTSDNNNVQTLDLIESVGDAESFCRSNAIKYLSRYDKKGQAKRDILKALHYSLLLYHFSGQLNETTTRGYETF